MLSLTLFSHSVSTLSLHYFTFITFAESLHIHRRKPQRGVQSFDKVSTLTLRALSSFSLRGFSKKKGELLQSVFHFYRLVAGKQWEKSKKIWFQFVFFYCGFCFEFLIELLKKIETLLFFEIRLYFWVCLYLLWNRIMFLGLFIFAEDFILVLC